MPTPTACDWCKAIRAPNNTGLILGGGRFGRSLIEALREQSFPSYGIGRPFKVNKESIIALVTVAGAAIAARHVWITAQPPGTVAECGASLDYMLEVLPLKEVLAKVLTGSGECGKIDWRFLGLSMPAWVLVWMLALGAWGLFVNLRRR